MRNLNALPLSALRVIEAVARCGTLARAADDLGVTAGALSQRLSKAEEVLGQPMFLRTPRGLKPTTACARIAPRLTRALSDLSSAVAEITAEGNCALTVTVAPIFASRWLIWRIKRFSEANPSISLRLLPTVEIVDLDRSDIDVALRYGPEGVAGPRAVRLLEQRVFPVLSPSLATAVRRVEDLFDLPVIRENDALDGWDVWMSANGLTGLVPRSGPTFADGSLCLDAAMTGQGVFMAWETLACDALERHQVVAPFSLRVATGSAYWFATARHAADRPAVRKFRTWLQFELDQSVRDWQSTGP